jgi:hypothetical protein
MEPKTHKRHLRRLRLKERLRFVRRISNRPKVWKEILLGMSVIFLFLAIVGGVAWAAIYFGKSSRDESAPPEDSHPEIVQPIEEPRLLGSWQRDAEKTIAEIRKSESLSNEEEAEKRRELTPLRVTYTATKVTIETKDETDVEEYQIVSKRDDDVVVKVWLPKSKEVAEIRISFVDRDTYRMEIEKYHLIECFRRVH